ncbi:ABC transporter substrate-binding protein [Deinococcus sp.]|uniref:ABC transporter substrate-binding protein n=1 Tax=Deinococcus sp. TaxID=47478 RepID=UPI003B5CF6A4
MVGNGPFVLKSWIPGQKLVLARNPGYFDKANAAQLDEVQLLLGLSDQVALLRAERSVRLDHAQCPVQALRA